MSQSFDTQINQNRAQLDNVTQVMQQNIQNVMERDINLRNLEENAENLNHRANDFQTTANKTKRIFIWRNTKWTMILIVTVVILVLVIALAIGLGVGLRN